MQEGKDFIIKIIQFLQNKHGISFFITSKDFDALYNWWEKRIPLLLIKESITNVVIRFSESNKKIRGFSTFKYEVRKNYKAFLQLNVGNDIEESPSNEEEKNPFAELDSFLLNFPNELINLKDDFEDIFSQIKRNETPEPSVVIAKMLDLFKEDSELNIKTAIFLRNLSPKLRNPDIEQRYRQNYLLNKFRIPEFTYNPNDK